MWRFVGLMLLTLLSSWAAEERLPPGNEVPQEVLQAANLTSEQLPLLQDIRWDPSRLPTPNSQFPALGVPDGVDCERRTWCDALWCTEVCTPGTVRLEPWFRHAMKTQIALSRDLPLCYTQWLGTHNSAITMVNGYGNRDRYYTELLQLTKWANFDVRTNNQWLSITDQLNMGARMIELDVHWVKGALRIAHCGGFSSIVLDYLGSLLNVVAALLQSPFRWDSETIGCDPSGSSIAPEDQRLFSEAIQEVAHWLHQVENKDEFLMILLDDQLDLAIWGLLPLLRKQLMAAIPYEQIFTPLDMYHYKFDALPSANTLLKMGKRVMFLSIQYYSDLTTRNFLFYTREGKICGWREPHPEALALDTCTFPAGRKSQERRTMTGQVCRLQQCELHYGPFACHTGAGSRPGVLDRVMLKEVFACGYNFPCPDGLTPERAAAAIWSWAPGHPHVDHASFNAEWQTVIRAEDGLWRSQALNASTLLPIACRSNHSNLHFIWSLHLPSEGLCGPGFIPGVPRHGKENTKLQTLLLEQGIPAARLIGAPLLPHSVY